MSEKLDSYYSDITTGLATTLIASIFSFITFIALVFFGYKNITVFSLFICLVIYSSFIILVFLNFYRTFKAYEEMINIAFATEVFNEFERNKKMRPSEEDQHAVRMVYYKKEK